MKGINAILIISIALAVSACGKKRGYYVDDGVNAGDQVAEADTATADAGTSGVEELPRLDEGMAAPAPLAQSEPTYSNPESPTYSNTNNYAPAPSRSTAAGQVDSYTVHKGDTLMKIAFNLYGDLTRWRDIYELNKDSLSDANALSAGMRLKFERPEFEPTIERNGDPYLIKPGDTLGKIADDVYAKRSKWKKLYENNRTLIRDPNKIYAGFYLYYQMSEQDKAEYEQIRGSGSRQQLGSTDGLNHEMGKNSLKGGALQSLAAPAEDGEEERNPSSAK